MSGEDVLRDERTSSVENASYRWGYLVLAFGILVYVAIQGFVQHQASWGLLALVIVSGLVTTVYQGLHKILTRRWAAVVIGAMVVAALLGVAITALR